MSKQVKEVGVASYMPATQGFTMACFKAEDVAEGCKLYIEDLAAANKAAEEGGLPEGMVIAPHYRGYARLGIGAYVINHTADKPAELIISMATDEEKAGRVVGDNRDNPAGHMLQPDAMAVRLCFENVEGLNALENQLAMLRDVHFPEAIAADRASRQVANKAEVEQVAWMTPSDWKKEPLATADVSVANAWRRDNREVTPLFATLPANKAEVEPMAVDREAVRDAVADSMTGLYHCGRVWSAWGYGTMSESDFSLAADDEDILDNITDAVIAASRQVANKAEVDAKIMPEKMSSEMFRAWESISNQLSINDMEKIYAEMYEVVPPANKAEVDLDAGFLQWIHDRMRFVHGENENVDYMHKLRAIIASVPADRKTTNMASVATPPATTGASTGWQKLNDVQWMNIVNHDRAYESYSKDEAVHEAVKRTEAKLKELNTGSVGASTVLTDERIAAVFKELGVAGAPMPNTYKFARAIEREVAAQASHVGVPEIIEAVMAICKEQQEFYVDRNRRELAGVVSALMDRIGYEFSSPAKESK